MWYNRNADSRIASKWMTPGGEQDDGQNDGLGSAGILVGGGVLRGVHDGAMNERRNALCRHGAKLLRVECP